MKSSRGVAPGNECAVLANPRNASLHHPVIKPSASRKWARSKKFPEQQRIADSMQAAVDCGQTINELQFLPLCGRYVGDAVRAMRKLAQSHPADYRMFLERGLWHLAPRGEPR